MKASPGGFLVTRAMWRGMVLFVDTDGVVKYYPASKMTPGFLRLINRHYYQVKAWLLADAVSGGD